MSYAIPSPNVVRGYVLEDDGETQALNGTLFSANNTANGYFVQGVTGIGELNPGKYSVVVNGSENDLVIIHAWNLSKEGYIQILLAGSMYNVNIQLNQTRPNYAPTIISSANTTVAEDSAYYYYLNVTDDPLDVLTYSLNLSPSGMSINPSTGLISWAPNNSHAGLNNVTTVVTDLQGEHSEQSFVVNVTPVNDAPSINSTHVTSAVQDVQYTYLVTAYDIDNMNSVAYDDNALTYLLLVYPDGMTINSSSGLISWAPGNDDVGENNVVVRVSDGSANDTESFTVTVENINDGPSIESMPVLSGSVGSEYSYALLANDPDDDELEYRLTIAPSGMSINGTSGLITWTPLIGQIGEHAVDVTVSDGILNDSQSFVVNITSNENQIEFSTSPVLSVSEGFIYSYNADVSGEAGNSAKFYLISKPTNMTINEVNGNISWTPSSSQIGNHSILLKANNTYSEAYQSFIVEVLNVNEAPVFSSSAVTSVAEDNAYEYYSHAVDPDGDQLAYALLSSPANATINSVSGTVDWQTSNYDVGLHNFTIRASDGQLSANQSFVVNVTPINDAPVIVSISDSQAIEGENFVATVDAYDIDNLNNVEYDDDTLTYSLSTSEQMSIGFSSGEITWDTSGVSAGSYTIIVSVGDGDAITQASFSITIQSNASEEDVPQDNPDNNQVIQVPSGGGGGARSTQAPIGETAVENVDSAADAINEKIISGNIVAVEGVAVEVPYDAVRFAESMIDIDSGNKMKIPVSEQSVAITDFTISVASELTSVANAEINVNRLSVLPGNVPIAAGADEVYQYLEISPCKISIAELKGSIVRFKVDKEWIEESGNKKENVVLSRFNNNKWNDLPTGIESKDDDEDIYYTSITPGFSVFAITFKKEAQRPKVSKNLAVVSTKLVMPFHLFGRIYYSHKRAMLPSGVNFTAVNIATNKSYNFLTGAGHVSGAYSILIDGKSGDLINISTDGWSTVFKLSDNKDARFKEMNLVTTLDPEKTAAMTIIQWICTLVYLISLVAIIIVVYIVMHHKKKLNGIIEDSINSSNINPNKSVGSGKNKAKRV